MSYFFRLKIKDAEGIQIDDYYIELADVIITENTKEAWHDALKRTSCPLVKKVFKNAASVDFEFMWLKAKGITFIPTAIEDLNNMQGSYEI